MVEYRFTFMPFTGGAQDTVFYQFTHLPADSSSSSGSVSSSTGSTVGTGNQGGTGNNGITASDWLAFLGRWQSDGSCVPTDTCCCATGQMTLLPVNSSINLFQLVGQLDGSQACMAQTSIGAVFTIDPTQHNLARYNLEHTTAAFLANISNVSVSSGSGDGNQPQPTAEVQALRLVFTNNVYPNCPSIMHKTADWDPSMTAAIPPTPVISSTGTGQSDVDESKFVGDYTFDETCEPGNKCCCGVGTMQVRQSPAGGYLSVLGALDGGPACLNMEVLEGQFAIQDGFTLVNQTQGLLFTASFNADYSRVTMANTYQKCVSTGFKGNSKSAALNLIWSPLIVFLCFLFLICLCLLA